MTIEFQYDPPRNRLLICGNLTILHAAEVLAQLKEQPGADLDLSGVCEMDGAGLQLMLVAQSNVGMRLVAVSTAVMEICELTGCSELMKDAK